MRLRSCRAVPLAKPSQRYTHVVRYMPSSGQTSGVTSTAPKQLMADQVHKWFASLAADDHPVEDFLSSNAKLFDNMNQACYTGYPAMKHRMQAVHEKLPHLVEVSEVTDAAHNCVAAHWVAHEASEEISGTYIFKFNDDGMIEEITAYQDSSEEEYPEA